MGRAEDRAALKDWRFIMSENTKNNTPVAEAEETAPKRKLSRGAIIAIIAAAVVLIAAIVTVIIVTSQPAEEEDDEQIEYIDVQANNLYSGVVEPQQTSDINKDPERTVSAVYVKVGDTVKKGDKLFAYDTEETQNKLSKAQIELESIRNNITECDNNISQLTRQRAAADESQQLSYTSQIQEQETAKSQAQLELKIKQVEIGNYQNNLDNSVVTSPIDGIIKQINDGESNMPSGAFMTVLMNGSFRIKAKVDEMNVRSLEPGMNVIIHSRTETGKTWEGTISKVDTATNAEDNSSMNTDSSDSAAKFYFYTSLADSEGLLLGEHVYVEPIWGGNEVAESDDSDVADTNADAADAPSADADTADANAEN